MADPYDYWNAALGVLVPVAAVSVCAIASIMWCPWRWMRRRMRLFTLGGVTTLTRTLNYNCSLCQDSMEAGEKVRTLSCDHAFHCGGGSKCERGVDHWLLQRMECPLCRQSPLPVPSDKQPPSSSPAPSPSASEATLRQLPPTSSETQDLEAALLTPHDKTVAEASSSASTPLLEPTQLPQTSTPDLPKDDEILPEASSSQ